MTGDGRSGRIGPWPIIVVASAAALAVAVGYLIGTEREPRGAKGRGAKEAMLDSAQKAKAKLSYLMDQVRKYPKSSDARRELGDAYMQLGQHDRALAEFREAAKLDPIQALHYE